MKLQKFIFFLGIQWCSAFITTFFDPLFSSYNLNKEWSQIIPIDDSHNEKHGKEVLFWAQEIVQSLDYKIHKNDLLMIGHCCLLHDLMDRKYKDLSTEVELHLERFHRPHEVELMMNVMKDMSYSKTVKQNQFILPEWLNESPFQDVFHITREADLLASYNLARMIEYRRAQNPFMKKEEGIQECIDLFYNRMERLDKIGVFVHPSAKKKAEHLKVISKLKLDLLPTVYEYKNLDILRIVNHLSIFDLVKKMNSLPSQYC